jgi:hypothetical protein
MAQAHIDTLKVYKEYLDNGYTESQASTAVKSLNASFDGVVTQSDLYVLEKDLKIFLGTEFGLILVAAIFLPFILKKFGWHF